MLFVMCADEPTSGLDSFQALNVMTALNDLASNGRTIICTIHQPRSKIFDLVRPLNSWILCVLVFIPPACFESHCHRSKK